MHEINPSPADGTSPTRRGLAAVAAGVLAAIGASLCCVAPLVLVSLGLGGAWVGRLTALEPYRPVFIGITVGFLVLAFYKLYVAPRRCAPDEACAVPSTLRNQRIIFWVVTVLVAALLAFPWYAPLFY